MSGPDVFGTNPYASNAAVRGEIVTVLRGVADNRGLQLESYRSRAVVEGHIHELMATDERAEPGRRVDKVALIGFFRIQNSGVLLVGARIQLGNRLLGTLAGFDETHMPNHQNVCVQVERLEDGMDLGLVLGEIVTVGG